MRLEFEGALEVYVLNLGNSHANSEHTYPRLYTIVLLVEI